MSFLSYDELVETIGSQWLARDDLAADIKDFIWLVECDAQRRIRLPETDAIISGTSIAGQNYIVLPDDYSTGVRVNWTGDTLLPTLELATRDIVFKAQQQVASNAPVPGVGDVFGNRLYIGPGPGSTDYELYYKRGTVHLGQNMQTNRLLQEYPDVLLHGSLLEAGLFLKDTDRVMSHAPLYQEAIRIARINEDKYKWGPGVLRMKPSVTVF